MGAEGKINIYDIAKFESKYDTLRVEKFFDLVTSDARTYEHMFRDVRVLTEYRSESSFGDSIIQKLVGHARKTKWSDPLESFELDCLARLQLSLDSAAEMAIFLTEKCKITDWEIWT